jgi:PhnB protein
MAPKPIPDAYRGAVPYLSISGAAKAIEFYTRAFGATEQQRLADASGKVMHAEIKIGDALVMLADEFPEMGFRSPESLGGSPVLIHLYVENVDAAVDRAAAAGAIVVRPPKTEFYGDRSASLKDPFGHLWSFATHVEDVSQEEMRRRFDGMMRQHGGS